MWGIYDTNFFVWCFCAKTSTKTSRWKPPFPINEQDDLDVANWIISQGRLSAINKKKHERLEKRYQEELSAQNKLTYSSKEMAGMKIDHRFSDLNQDRDTILVLEDKKILDEGAVKDVLKNVNIKDKERDRVNLRNKLTGVNYEPWRDIENEAILEDTITFGKTKNNVLRKYDEVIHGENFRTENDYFMVGKDGNVDMEEMEGRDLKKARENYNRKGGVSLALPEYKEQSDYQTVDFKKTKRKKERDQQKEEELRQKLLNGMEQRKSGKKLSEQLKVFKTDLRTLSDCRRI